MLTRRRLIAGVTTLALGAMLSALAYAAVGLPSLCPNSNGLSGWQALDADKLASNADELWKIYNGGDGEWKTAGVTCAFARHYQNTKTKKVLSLTINKTGTDWTKAKALFRSKNDSLDDQQGYQTVELKQQGSLTALAQGGLHGHLWSKYYYCTVESADASSTTVGAAKQLMQKVAESITKNG
jgi:hypothetical protein